MEQQHGVMVIMKINTMESPQETSLTHVEESQNYSRSIFELVILRDVPLCKWTKFNNNS